MKYIVMLGDGMADYPLQQLNNKTPLQVAHKPNIDSLVSKAIVGMVKTIPDGMKPGSDVANLSAMGYDPLVCYTGRSPLEAISMGIPLLDNDIALRCNLVTLSDEPNYEDKTMLDYCSDEISTEDASQLIQAVNMSLQSENIHFYTGISYRHCMIWQNGQLNLNLTPPHDISDKKIKPYLPKEKLVLNLMKKSFEILNNHTINLTRKNKGLHPANSIWLWGEGTRPSMNNFYDTYGVHGSVISAVDLIKGMGICVGLNVITVPGATGNIDTNYKGKGEAALFELLNGQDFVYIHVEAPDECGHRGEIENKIKSIEYIDKEIVGPLLRGLEEANEEYSILIMPDHPTPIILKTHVCDPIPFLLYKNSMPINSNITSYDEENARKTGLFIENGCELMNMLIQNGQ